MKGRRDNDPGWNTGRQPRILITGGGTGGHIYPGLAVAEAVAEAVPAADIRFAGTAGGLEAELIPRAGYRLIALPASGFRGLGMGARLAFAFNTTRGILRALPALVRWRPTVVLGTGGYASVPALAAALLLGIPCALQEQNSVPGSANRLLGRWMRRIYLGFAAADRFFPPRHCRHTGNPVRRAVVEAFAAAGSHDTADEGTLNILVFGGSRGARTLNRAVMAAAGDWASQEGRAFLVQTGTEELAEVTAACAHAANIEVVAYIQDMASALRWADLVVCRAGAMTLAEIQCAGKPAILVPYPHATDDHQRHNADDCAAAGAAVVLRDEDCHGESLTRLMDGLLRDGAKLARMGQAARGLARPEAAKLIAGDLLALAGHPAGTTLPPPVRHALRTDPK